ncbi:MAG: ADP-ribosylglycohydrolase family protein [Methylococcaceae bacterium]
MYKKLSDQIYGVIFGQAIGDALGVGTEFMSKRIVGIHYPQGLYHYRQIIRDTHRKRWPPGSWTDDTDQLLCIFDSILDKNTIDIIDIAARIYTWASEDGRGLGRLSRAILNTKNFQSDPHEIAYSTWKKSGCTLAPNGGVMRTAILGIWEYNDLDKVRHNAEQVCKITHYDPRCVGSAVAVSMAISLLLQGMDSIPEILDRIVKETECYGPELVDYINLAIHGDLAYFDLDEGLNPGDKNNSIGYTLKTMGAGFWALIHAENYEQGILSIIHEGGDADTNAAVAGALLGARYGVTTIPKFWIKGLHQKQALIDRIERLMTSGIVTPE